MPHGSVYSRAGTADGPRRRISVQRNAGSSPSIASTTSSSVISVGGPRQPVAAARPLHRLEHAGARERLEVLGEVRRRHAVVLGELRRRQRPIGRDRGEHRARVHAPLDTVREPHNPDSYISAFRRTGYACCDRMATVDEVELLPDPEQHKLLVATLERVNRASNAARAAGARSATCSRAPALRDIVKEEVERAKLPDGFVRPITRPGRSVAATPGGQAAEVLDFQSLTLPAVGVQVGRLGSGHDAHRGGPPHDLGARRPQPRRPAAAARRAGPRARVPQRRVRAATPPTSTASRRGLTTALTRSSRTKAATGESPIGVTSNVCEPRPSSPCSSCKRRLGEADAVRHRPTRRTRGTPTRPPGGGARGSSLRD